MKTGIKVQRDVLSEELIMHSGADPYQDEIKKVWTAKGKAVVDQDGFRILEADAVTRIDDLSSKQLENWWDNGGYFIRSQKEMEDVVKIASMAPEMIAFLKEVHQTLSDCSEEKLGMFEHFLINGINKILSQLP